MAVIGIAQQKGGAGKTTLAVQLGIASMMAGRRIAMLDIDPQGSLSAWFDLRRRRLGDQAGGLVVQALSGWRLGAELSRLRRQFDDILVDSPPHAETDARAVIREADLALLPCQPNALDVWATEATLEFARHDATDALLVFNRVPARGRAAQTIRTEVETAGWSLPPAWATARLLRPRSGRGRVSPRQRRTALLVRRSPLSQARSWRDSAELRSS